MSFSGLPLFMVKVTWRCRVFIMIATQVPNIAHRHLLFYEAPAMSHTHIKNFSPEMTGRECHHLLMLCCNISDTRFLPVTHFLDQILCVFNAKSWLIKISVILRHLCDHAHVYWIHYLARLEVVIGWNCCTLSAVGDCFWNVIQPICCNVCLSLQL